MAITKSYNIFYRFIENHLQGDFSKINRNDPYIRHIDNLLKNNGQFLTFGDLMQLRILFTSSGSYDIIGIRSDILDPASFFAITHPDDLARHQSSRLKMISLAHELFLKKEGTKIISTSIRIKKPGNSYFNLLIQCFLFFSPVPCNTVYNLTLYTDLSWLKEFSNRLHYYVGNDTTFFRYPDPNILLAGDVFTNTEYSIIQYLEQGLDNAQIAKKLVLRESSIETSRRNILKKTGKATTDEMILDLKERGLL